MTELVAVQNNFALFNVRGRGVVVNTVEMNASDPEPLTAALARGGWVDTSVKPLPVWVELAEAAVDDVGTVVASADRDVRVPQRVQEAANRALQSKIPTTDPNSRVALKAANKLSTGTVALSTVKRIHQYFTNASSETAKIDDEGALTAAGLVWLAWGGDSGRDWAAKTVASALTSAGDVPADPELPDPSAPHEFILTVADPTVCQTCSLSEDDANHTMAQGDETPEAEYFGIFDPEFNGPTFRISSVLAKDAGGAWWVREQGDWSPTEAPTDGADLALLDEESLVAAVQQLDKPGATVAELSIDEDRLFALASTELDYDLLDAVFRLAPYVPPQVRSDNASKQLRDANGRFFTKGASVATSDGVVGVVEKDNEDGTIDVKLPDGTVSTVGVGNVQVADDQPVGAPAGTPVEDQVPGKKASLDAPGTVTPDIKSRLDDYGAGADAPVTAAGDDSMLIPPADPPGSVPSGAPLPSGSAPGTPSPTADAAPLSAVPADGEDGTAFVDGSSVPPLYLADVDPNDTTAVLDLYAIVPADPDNGTELSSFKRQGGKWVADSTILVDLRGPTPPTVVELDEAKLQSVLGQIDSATNAAPDPVSAGGYSVLQRFIIENDALVATATPGPVLLQPYGAILPNSIIDQLNELADGGGADRNRGNAERLRRYWEHGEGAAKIRWGESGDWERCVHHLEKFMGVRARGYCQLRHKGATGFYAGHAPTEQEPGKHH